ncbi:DUF3500 domain-containing protein [Akkermansiaceae bacterium]|nr:DUF3500 domain-containing protein [Akkermansiaceae bacterium]
MKTSLLLGLISAASLLAREPAKPSADLTAVTTEMAAAANAFLSSLGEAQAKKARFPFESDQREAWGFVPRARKGVPLEDLDEKQTAHVRTLLKTALSDPGLGKVDAIMALEAFLAEIEKRPDFRNPKAYFTSVFGEPKAGGTWGWRFEGHHLSLNYTIADGKAVSVTPSFFATNPGEVMIDHPMKGTRPLAAEEDLARALATTLRETGKQVVFSEKPPGEILTAEDRKAKQLDPVGVIATEMTAAQQAALKELIAEFANRHRKELAEADLAKILADMDKLRFGWAGGLKRGEPYYYRIQGTTFLVEVANVQNNGNHVHATWRDQSNDFGNDLLGDHVGHDH